MSRTFHVRFSLVDERESVVAGLTTNDIKDAWADGRNEGLPVPMNAVPWLVGRLCLWFRHNPMFYVVVSISVVDAKTGERMIQFSSREEAEKFFNLELDQ